jgi:hypothetical protein
MQWTKGGPYQTPRVDERFQDPEVSHEVKDAVPDESRLSSSPSTYQSGYRRPAVKAGSLREVGSGKNQTDTGNGPSRSQQGANADTGGEDQDSKIIGIPRRQDSRASDEAWNKVFHTATGGETSVKKGIPISERPPLVFEPMDTDTDEGPPGSAASYEIPVQVTSERPPRRGVGNNDTRSLSKATGSALMINELDKNIDQIALQLGTEGTKLPAIPSLPTQEDSFSSISDSFGTLLGATANPYVHISHLGHIIH